jgi:protein translocase SecG subunit
VTTTTLILVILLWPLCLFIIGMILLQGGAGDLSSSFGGGGQLDSTLGVGAGRKMSKITGWLGGAFLLIVTILSIHHDGDLDAAAGGKGTAAPALQAPSTFPQTGTTTQSGKAAVAAPATDAAKPGVVTPPAATKQADGSPAPAAPTSAPAAPVAAPATTPAAAPSAPTAAPEAPKAPSAPALVPEAPAAAPAAAAPAAPVPAPTAEAPAAVPAAPAPAAPAHSGVQLDPK